MPKHKTKKNAKGQNVVAEMETKKDFAKGSPANMFAEKTGLEKPTVSNPVASKSSAGNSVAQKMVAAENPAESKFVRYWISLKILLRKNLSTVYSWGILIAWIVFTLFSFFALGYWGKMFEIVEVPAYQFVIPEKINAKLQCDFAHPVTGVCLQSKEEEKYTDDELAAAQVFTVMVENHTAARPQSGLSEADVVYEALVEGGFTRFLTVFDSLQAVKAIGPVRSARDYYLWWAKEYNNPVYAHVGGSPKALDLIASQGMIDCDEFYHGNIFERVNWRSAPHNTYVAVSDLALCRPTMETAGLFDEIDSWQFADGPLDETLPKVENLQISYSQNTNYDVEWQYNAEDGLYYRFNAGQPHLDKNNNQQITAKNVIVMEALSRVIDDIGRLEMNNIGSGPVLIYTQGTKQKGVWEKDHYSDRTRFVDKEGNELLLSPGNTWFQVVPSYFNAITEK